MPMMTGHQFEEYCANYLKGQGFSNVEVTPASGDNGADILATKDGLRYAFQCKYYDGTVGNKAIQEVYAAKAYYRCDKCVVITNSQFTNSAIDTANRLDVELWSNFPVYTIPSSGNDTSNEGASGFEILGGILIGALEFLLFPFKFAAWLLGIGRKH